MISQLQWTGPPIPKPQPNWASLIQVKIGYETWILEKYQFPFEFGRKPWTLSTRSWEPPASQRSSVFSDFHWCGAKASPFDSPEALSFHLIRRQRFGKGHGGIQTVEDFVLMLWGESRHLQPHALSTWKMHTVNHRGHVWWHSLFLLLSYWRYNQPVGRTRSLCQVSVLSGTPLNYRRAQWPSRRLFENWARRECFPSALSNVNELNAKGPERGLAYLVWLQNLFCLTWGSQTSAMVNEDCHHLLGPHKWQCFTRSAGPSWQQRLAFCCWKLGKDLQNSLALEAGIEVEGKWVAVQTCPL